MGVEPMTNCLSAEPCSNLLTTDALPLSYLPVIWGASGPPAIN